MSSLISTSTKYDQIISKGKAILQEEAQAISATGLELGDSFYHAVEMIVNCEGKIVITGIGKSGWIGRKISSTMSSLGIPAVYMSPAEGLHGDLGMVQKNDIVLSISKSGESQEIIDILPSLKKIKSKMIAITSNQSSTIGKYAEIVLSYKVEKEACHLNLAPTTSTTVTLVIGDALALVVSELKGFTSSDFAIYHPGGSLGKRLTLNVEDLLVAESYTFVNDISSFQAIVLELTRRPLGGTVVLNSRKEMIGIITDGDLRRAIEKYGEQSFGLKASKIMTENPITIKKGITAGQAIKIMEKNQREISVIPVLDDNKYIGILRLHDILKLG